MKTLGQMGEHAVIAALTANLKATGDDCAVLPQPGSGFDLVLTTDPLVENMHFTADAAPESVGHKAASRVLSDFAAMGSEPQYLLINVVAPPEQDFETLEKIYAGITAVCDEFGAEIVGGDLAQGSVLELHVFGVGRVPAGKALLRSGAKPGDFICVSGPLGGSFDSGKHLTFTPRVREGQWLRESGCVSSMMDISDGLATDLRHILKASRVGAAIDGAAVPANGSLEGALFDGEDFELLFTVASDRADAFDVQCLTFFGQKFARIGRITDQPETMLLDGVPLEGKAFEHFKR